MTADYKNSRLYLEIMREATLLGDKFLVDMVGTRLANLARSPLDADAKSKVISFPKAHLTTMPAFSSSQRMWVTVLLTAMIPFGIVLILMACHFFSLFGSIPCLT